VTLPSTGLEVALGIAMATAAFLPASAVEMRHRRRAGKPRIGHLPAQLLGGGVIVDIRGAFTGAGIGRHFGRTGERRFKLFGERGSGERRGGSECEGRKDRFGIAHVSLPVGFT
jgi:hypothetical protein